MSREWGDKVYIAGSQCTLGRRAIECRSQIWMWDRRHRTMARTEFSVPIVSKPAVAVRFLHAGVVLSDRSPSAYAGVGVWLAATNSLQDTNNECRRQARWRRRYGQYEAACRLEATDLVSGDWSWWRGGQLDGWTIEMARLWPSTCPMLVCRDAETGAVGLWWCFGGGWGDERTQRMSCSQPSDRSSAW